MRLLRFASSGFIFHPALERIHFSAPLVRKDKGKGRKQWISLVFSTCSLSRKE